MTCLPSSKILNFPTETLPDTGRLELPIKQLGPKQWLVDYPYRRPNGKATHKTEIVHGTKIDAAAKLVEIVKLVEERSLKSDGPLFQELVDLVLKKNNGAGMPWVYSAIKDRFRGVRVNDSFSDEYEEYIEELEEEDYALNTIANHKSAIQTTLRHAKIKRKIHEVPIQDFEIKRTARDRVWHSDSERTNFFNQLIEKKSHLYWSMVLLERRPIRARSDLWRLTDKNLELFDQEAPYLHYLAKKTSKKVNRETYMPLKGMDDILEYLTHGRPKDCPLLFPRLEGKVEHVHDFDGWSKCAWFPMGKPRRHFLTVCGDAEIEDLHIHDFKHMAVTHMINDEGYSIEQLLAMGVQFTEKMLKKVYWHKNALKSMVPAHPVACFVACSENKNTTIGQKSAA